MSGASANFGCVSIVGFEPLAASRQPPIPRTLDPSQRLVIDLADDRSASVLGAPGTGKTTTIVELVADRVLNRGWSPDSIVVLTPTRASATRLRDRLALRLAVSGSGASAGAASNGAQSTSALATNGPLARTVNSLAFEIVGAAARAAGAETPRLVTGGEQDADIAALLEGNLLEGTGPAWPESLGPDVRRLRGFRTELRELFMRATEYDVSPARLRQLGETSGHPEWIAAAQFFEEYVEVTTTSRPSQFDATEFARYAVAAIDSGAKNERLDALRLVIADDLQEATESTLAILRSLAARGIAVIVFGDPDVAANAFRGGEPDALGRLSSVLGIPDPATLTLAVAHRQGPALRALTSAATARIGAASAGTQRAATAGSADSGAADLAHPIRLLSAATPARLWAALARQLREQHLLHGVAWSDMAVVVRSGAQTSSIRRALALAEVPARTAVGGAALRDDRAASALLAVVDVGTGRSELTPDLAAELLLSPFGGLDPLALRRLRLALRTEEIAGGGSRQSGELLVDALAAPGRLATIDHRVARSADRLARSLAELRAMAEAGATIEELLWQAWQASGLAEPWFGQALSAGITAAEANANLDGIVALFTSAKRFVERRPGTPASVFLDEVLDAEVPEDTLSPQPTADAVLVATASGVVGLEFQVVVVAGLQDGAWPNLRLRGSLLAPQELVRILTGIDSAALDERKLVLGDELRLFALAVSRARRLVILAAVANDDEAVSVFFSLAPAAALVLDTKSRPPLSLRGLAGHLRRELVSPELNHGKRQDAAAALRALAEARVPGADPADWHGLLEPSTTDPLYLDDELVPISPSRLERFEDSPLDWFIETVSGGSSSTPMALGTILHWAMETATDPTIDAVWASVESRWDELLFESPWVAESQRRAARLLAAAIAEYLADFQREGKQLVGAERRFEFDIGRARVSGSIDRVERSPDGSIVIVDLKTGRPIVTQSLIDDNAQLGVYQLAYAQGVLDEFLDELGPHHSGGAKLLYVREGRRSKLYLEGRQAALTDEQLEGFRTRIRQAAAGMAAAEYRGALELGTWGSGASGGLAIHRVRAVSSD
jgi:superfamily I DNA/RNA helicase/RecB family exonuclease